MTDKDPESTSLRHARIRRVKQLLRWMPRRTNLQRYPVLKRFAHAARKRPYLWSFKVAQVSPAFYAGCIIAFLPLYGIQLALSFFAALLFRANLPITCGLQIITNPLTLAPLYYFTYQLGKWIIEVISYGEGVHSFGTRINALIIGGLIVGTAVAGVLDFIYRFAARQATLHQRAHAARARNRSGKTPPVPPPPPSPS